jgi:hypothetical protein
MNYDVYVGVALIRNTAARKKQLLKLDSNEFLRNIPFKSI